MSRATFTYVSYATCTCTLRDATRPDDLYYDYGLGADGCTAYVLRGYDLRATAVQLYELRCADLRYNSVLLLYTALTRQPQHGNRGESDADCRASLQ